MSNINFIPSSAGASAASLGSTTFSSSQIAFQNALKSLQNTPLRSRLVLQMAGPANVQSMKQSKQNGIASQELMRQQIARDCGYHPAL